MLPNAQLVLLEGAGHLIIFERPSEYAAAVIDFTAGLAAERAARLGATRRDLFRDADHRSE